MGAHPAPRRARAGGRDPGLLGVLPARQHGRPAPPRAPPALARRRARGGPPRPAREPRRRLRGLRRALGAARADPRGARSPLHRAGGDAAPHRGLAPHGPGQAHAGGRVPRRARQREPVAARAPRDRGAAAGGDHDPLAERRDAVGPTARDRRGATGALLLRGGALRHDGHGARGARPAAAPPLPGPALPGGLPALRLVGRRRPGRQPQLHARARGRGPRPPQRPGAPDAAGAGARPGRGPRDLHADGAGERGARRLDRGRRARDAGDRRRDRRPQRRRALPAQAVVRVGAPGPAASARTRAPRSWWRIWR